MVLVTGGLGFIGNELVRQLVAAGHEVAILDNRNRVAPRIEDLKDVPVYELDLTDRTSVEALFLKIMPETVFHMAAIHYIPECNDNPERTLRVNVEGTSSILNAAAAAGVKKVLFASSGAVYADSADLLTENSPVAPVDIYGWSKWFGEELCQFTYNMHGTAIVICRLFNNYGPRETNMHIIPEVIYQLTKGDVLQLGNISTIRDYIHTSDCAQSLIRLSAVCEGAPKIVNVATGEGYSVQQMIDKIAVLTGRNIRVETDMKRFRKVDKQSQVADISLLRQLTGWSPEVSITEGLERLLEFEGAR